jgi:hypothetical protein
MASKGINLDVWNLHAKSPKNNKSYPSISTLAQTLKEEKDWRSVVSAVEKTGLTGWDRFGRWGEFKPKDRTVVDALDAIAHVLQQKEVGYEFFDVDDYIESTAGLHNLHFVGWRIGHLPDFRKFKNDAPSKPSIPRKESVRQVNNDLLRMAFLLRLLTGEEGGDKHPLFSTDKSIKEYAQEKFGHLDGLASRTLEDKFSEARKHWREINN